jgi:hypothetical protein
MHNKEWMSYLLGNLEQLEGLDWADKLQTYIFSNSNEIEKEAQKFRAQMYFLKYSRQLI